MEQIGSPNMDCRAEGSVLDPSLGRASYLFNTTIDGIEDADAIMLIGTNPRKEAPILNARIRKRYTKGDLLIGVVGEQMDLTYEYTHLGEGPEALKQFSNYGKIKKKNPMFIIGQGALNRSDSAAVMAMVAYAAASMGALRDDWNGFNILHTGAAQVGGLDLGFVPGKGGKATGEMMGSMELLFLLGADEMDMAQDQGHCGLYRIPRRCRCAPGGYHSSGRCLYGKIGHLGQHRGPRSDGQPCQFCAW